VAVPASAIPTTARVIRSRKPPQEDSESLLRSLGRQTLSGLAAVGNVLDLPGSSVRDVLTGQNPLDQWASPISGENRVSGRDVLERYGLLGKNRKGLDAGDVAGFGAEVLLDPLSALTGVGTLKALGRGGTVLSKASKAPRSLSRIQRMTTTVGDLARQIPADALQHAATRSGYASTADFLARHGGERVGGLLGVGVPFRSPSFAVGTGPLARKIGGGLDKLLGGSRPTSLAFGPQRARVLSEASEAFGPEAGKAIELHDAYATKWAQQTGQGTEDYYSRISLRKGDPSQVGAEALQQSPGRRLKATRVKTERGDGGLRITGLPKGSVESIKQAMTELVAAADSNGQAVEASRYLPLELPNTADQEALSGFLKELGFKRTGDSLRRAASSQSHEDAILAAMQRQPESLHVFQELREQTGIPKAEFDAAVLKMAREGKISLHQHDFPHSPAETDASRSQYVQGAPTSRYLGEEPTVPHYIGAALRKSSGAGNAPSSLSQSGRGAVEFTAENQKAIITAFQSADISTFAHESGHVFRRWLGEVDDKLLKQAEGSLNVSAGQWTREAEEAFASGFERYLRDGQAPTSALRAVFESFKNWLTQIYQSIVGTPLEQSVNPQLKRVFDQMLTPQGASGGLMNTAPVRQAAALFNRANRGATSQAGAELGQAATAAERAAQLAAREQFAPHLRSFEEFAQTLPDTAARLEANDALRAAVEGVAPLRQDMAHLQPIVDEIRRVNAEQLAREQSEGLMSSALDDLFVDYTRRQRFFFPGDKSKGDFPSLLLSGKHGSQTQRADILRDIHGGTQLINKLSIDPNLAGVAHGKRPAELTKEFWDNQERLVNDAMSAAGYPNWMYEHSRGLARWLADLDPRHVSEKVPVFPGNPIEEALRRKEIGDRAIGLAQAIRESVGPNAVDFDQAPAGYVSVRDVLARANLDVDATLQLLGLDANSQVPRELAEDIGRVVKSFRQPEEVHKVIELLDKFTALFKVGVLTFPARYTRDLMSGQVQNFLTGAFSWRSLNDADKLIRGRGPIKGLQKLGGKYANLSDEAATRKFAEEIFAQDVASTSQGITSQGAVAGTSLARSMATEIPGVAPLQFRKIASKARPRTLAQANPLNVAGVRGTETQFSLAAAGNDLGRYTDSNIRITGYLELRRKGWSPERAAERIRLTQVDYQALSDFERGVVRRAMPFYSFSRGIAEFLVKELADRPGGGIAQAIRASNQGRGEGPLPEYIAQGMAVPLGMSPDGTQSFLTGAGLMHEDTTSLFGARGGLPDVRGTLVELGSRLAPQYKFPIEFSVGESLFQRGPMGGRDVLDQDPTIGRLISNVGELAGLPAREFPGTGRARPFLSTGFEQLAANLPSSRLATTLRTLTDQRKWEGGLFPGSKALLNVGTGFRVSDLSPQAQEAMLRDELAALSRESGAKAFETVRFTKSQIAAAERADPEFAQRMRALNAAAAELAARAKKRAKIRPPAR
jgi:hypothetical protein